MSIPCIYFFNRENPRNKICLRKWIILVLAQRVHHFCSHQVLKQAACVPSRILPQTAEDHVLPGGSSNKVHATWAFMAILLMMGCAYNNVTSPLSCSFKVRNQNKPFGFVSCQAKINTSTKTTLKNTFHQHALQKGPLDAQSCQRRQGPEINQSRKVSSASLKQF